jgi:hypothetical protein
MMLRVRTLPTRFRPWSFAVFLFALAWGIVAVAAFVLIEDRLVAAGVAALGIPLFLYGVGKSGRESQERTCPACQGSLPPALESGPGSGEPILYHCKKCEILWFAGCTRPW